MGRAKPISVKLSDDMLARVDSVSKRSGLQTRSSVIKFCLTTFLDHFEQSGEASLPPNWRDILREVDQRTHRYDGVDVKRKRAREIRADSEES